MISLLEMSPVKNKSVIMLENHLAAKIFQHKNSSSSSILSELILNDLRKWIIRNFANYIRLDFDFEKLIFQIRWINFLLGISAN